MQQNFLWRVSHTHFLGGKTCPTKPQWLWKWPAAEVCCARKKKNLNSWRWPSLDCKFCSNWKVAKLPHFKRWALLLAGEKNLHFSQPRVFSCSKPRVCWALSIQFELNSAVMTPDQNVFFMSPKHSDSTLSEKGDQTRKQTQLWHRIWAAVQTLQTFGLFCMGGRTHSQSHPSSNKEWQLQSYNQGTSSSEKTLPQWIHPGRQLTPKLQVPKMEVLNPYKDVLGVHFPCISRIHTGLYRFSDSSIFRYLVWGHCRGITTGGQPFMVTLNSPWL